MQCLLWWLIILATRQKIMRYSGKSWFESTGKLSFMSFIQDRRASLWKDITSFERWLSHKPAVNGRLRNFQGD